MKNLITAALLALGACHGEPTATDYARDYGAPDDTRVLLVMVDDIGFNLWTDAELPNIESLSAVGLNFRNYWSAPRCAVDRAMLYSGLESHRPDNLVGWGLPPGNDYELPVTGTLLPQVLPGQSTHRGKLHLAPKDRAPSWPMEAGFLDWSGTVSNLGANGSTGYYEYEETRPTGHYPQTQYATERYCEQALQDVLMGVEFVALHLHASHKPFDIPPPGTYTADTSTDYGISLAMLEAADFYLGPVLQTALDTGYLVILVSDNGSSHHAGGGKDTLLETGLNVPLVVAGPGVVPGITRALVQTTDLYATIAELRGSLFGAPPDSISFVPVLEGHVGNRLASHAQWFKPSGKPPKVGKWARAAREKRYKLLEEKDGTQFLFDLRLDPTETNNLLDGQLTGEQADAYSYLLSELPN